MSSGEGRSVPAVDIGGLAEVCEVIGYSDGYVTQLLADGSSGFPHPVTSIKAGRLWDLGEVRDWKKVWDQRPARKPGPQPGTVVYQRKEQPPGLSAEDRARTLDALLGRL